MSGSLLECSRRGPTVLTLRFGPDEQESQDRVRRVAAALGRRVHLGDPSRGIVHIDAIPGLTLAEMSWPHDPNTVEAAQRLLYEVWQALQSVQRELDEPIHHHKLDASHVLIGDDGTVHLLGLRHLEPIRGWTCPSPLLGIVLWLQDTWGIPQAALAHWLIHPEEHSDTHPEALASMVARADRRPLSISLNTAPQTVDHEPPTTLESEPDHELQQEQPAIAQGRYVPPAPGATGQRSPATEATPQPTALQEKLRSTALLLLLLMLAAMALALNMPDASTTPREAPRISRLPTRPPAAAPRAHPVATPFRPPPPTTVSFNPTSPPMSTPLPIPLEVTSPWGLRTDPVRGCGTDRHDGIDLRAADGTEVLAVLPGEVRAVHERGGSGLVVEVDHAEGFRTVYAHLSSTSVQPGAAVQAGQSIGRSGSSGRTTGPHLHLELRIHGDLVDPAEHLDVIPHTRKNTVTPCQEASTAETIAVIEKLAVQTPTMCEGPPVVQSADPLSLALDGLPAGCLWVDGAPYGSSTAPSLIIVRGRHAVRITLADGQAIEASLKLGRRTERLSIEKGRLRAQ